MSGSSRVTAPPSTLVVADAVTQRALNKLTAFAKSTYDFLVRQEPWKPVAFLNDFQDLGGNWQHVEYRRDNFGAVLIRGLCKRASASTAPIFTLPEGYRPKKDLLFWVNGRTGGARLGVRTDGSVSVDAAQDAAWYEFVSINISFEVT